MRKNSKRRFVFVIILTIIFAYSFIGSKGEMVENLGIPVAVGYDLSENGEYRAPIPVYQFPSSGDVISKTITGQSSTLGGTRDDRQRKADKRYLLGLEKLYVISEGWAEYGIRNIIDILLNNPQVSDRSPTIVYKGKAEDLLKHKIKGYANSAEYIEGMIKNSMYYNFFSSQFSMMDLIVRVDGEGRNPVLPYIELKEDVPEITGIAIFRGDKMIGKTNMQEAIAINLLKFSGGRGILSIQKDEKHYINFYAQSKRKAKCYKIDGKYSFVINIDLNGSIASNQLDSRILKDPKELKKFTNDMENSVKQMCTKYANKANHQYKTDIFELGRVAAAKYGRQTGVDWNEVVSQSNIEVKVKVTVKDEGRGSYIMQ